MVRYPYTIKNRGPVSLYMKRRRKMSVKRACFLNCGTVSAPHSGIEIFGDSHKTMVLPVAPALLDTDDGYVLYDTGLHPDGLTDPDGIWGDMKSAVVDFGPENTITHQLELAGVRQMNAIAQYLHGRVLVQHDPEFWKDVQGAPYWYE